MPFRSTNGIIPVLLDEDQPIPAQIEHLHVLDFTQYGKGTGPLQNTPAFHSVLGIIKTDAKYYNEHKALLTQALRWNRNVRVESLLLRGRNLENGRSWFKLAQNRELHQSTSIHQEFIAESEEKTYEQNPEVYISYSVKDADFSRKLNLRLQLAGRPTWFDQEGIGGEEGFTDENRVGVDACETFLLVSSPRAVVSDLCMDEIGYARLRNKRVISVQLEEVSSEGLHKRFKGLSKIRFYDKEFQQALEELVSALGY